MAIVHWFWTVYPTVTRFTVSLPAKMKIKHGWIDVRDKINLPREDN